VSITDPLGRTNTPFVAGLGWLRCATSPLGQVTTHTYDALNAVTQTTDALGGTTAFTYDANRNLLTLTDALNHTTTYTYDDMDRVETRTDPTSPQPPGSGSRNDPPSKRDRCIDNALADGLLGASIDAIGLSLKLVAWPEPLGVRVDIVE
jgi:YD repeat-containing protein